eukprot:5240987-Amphidinium_carterae.1
MSGVDMLQVLSMGTIVNSSPASASQRIPSPSSQEENPSVLGDEPEAAQLRIDERRLMDCSVYVLVAASIVDEGREGFNTRSVVQSLFPSTILWTDVPAMRAALTEGLLRNSLVIVPEQEDGSLVVALGNDGVALLQQHVQQNGAHLMVHGSNLDWTSPDARLINAVSGWSVAHTGKECVSDSSSRLVQRQLDGAGFDAGPASLPFTNTVYCMSERTLPTNVDGLYADDGECYAWTAGIGNGRITHIGADFHTTSPAWTQLIESSANAVCESQTDTRTSSSIGHFCKFIVRLAILCTYML